jgi:DNA (cytosine-5)-methyltransferase 3A
MKVLSLFDGISCGMVALERSGIPVERYVAYEIEPSAIKISQKNYPQIEHCGDVTTADFMQYQGFDLLIGGSPCQSLSITQSKTRNHLDGKSKLFFEFVRALGEVRPRYFLFENVASMNEESKQVISELLGCQPDFIDSGDFSAQQRPRLYWTNIPVCVDVPRNSLVLKDILLPNELVAKKYWYSNSIPIEDIDVSKQVCGTLVHNNHEMHKRLFNPDFKCHTLTCVSGGNQQKKVLVKLYGKYGDYTFAARKLTPIEYERLQTLPDNYTEGVSDGARYTACGNGWTVDVIAHIFTGLITERGVNNGKPL